MCGFQNAIILIKNIIFIDVTLLQLELGRAELEFALQ